VRLVVSDDHEGIKAAVAAEMPGVERQRCTVHFECNVPSYVLASEVAEDLRSREGRRREPWPRISWGFTVSVSRRPSPFSRRA
jgi:hypothetical protein